MSKKSTMLRQAPLFAAIAATLFTVNVAAGERGNDRNARAGYVTNGNDNGAGSLRAALSSGASRIVISKDVETILISSTLEYAGDRALRLQGGGQTIQADGDFTLLSVLNGANLMVSNLTFQGIGGFKFDVKNDDIVAGTGKGIFVDVPDDATGTVQVTLANVTVRDVANHGVHISDCSLADDCGGGSGGGGEGSPASVKVTLRGVTIDNAGSGKFDADGLRVDDRGAGSIDARIFNSVFTNMGADGVELDEGNEGNVTVDVRNANFVTNGDYCLGGWDTREEADANKDAIFAASEGACNDDDDLDVDDGMDVDEAGDGSFSGAFSKVIVYGNFDEGLDLDEEGAGDTDLVFTNVSGAANDGEHIKISEEDDGDNRAVLVNVMGVNGGDDGTQIESEDAGDTFVEIYDSVFLNNAKKGAKITSEGGGTAKVRNSQIDKLDLENVEEI